MYLSKFWRLRATHLWWVLFRTLYWAYICSRWETLSSLDSRLWIWSYGLIVSKENTMEIIHYSPGSCQCLPFWSLSLCGRANKSWVLSFLKKLQFRCGKAKMVYVIEMIMPCLYAKVSCCVVPCLSKSSVQVLVVWFTLFGSRSAQMQLTNLSRQLSV